MAQQPRYPSDPGSGAIPLQPAAAPVDSYVRPAQPTQYVGDPELQQFAQSLAQIQPSINKFLVDRQDRQDQAAADAGHTMRAQAMVNYKDAVRLGKISLDQNPFFTQAWKEDDGNVAADKFNADLTTALVTAPEFAGSTDNAQSNQTFINFRQNWMKQAGLMQGADDTTVEAFTRKANQYESAARAHQATQIGERVINDQLNNTYQLFLGAYVDGKQNRLPPSTVGESLQHLNDRLNALGVAPQKSNALLLDAATAQALQDKDTTLAFDALDNVRTGPGFLGRTAEVISRRQTIQREIDEQKDAAARAAHQQLEWQKQAGIDASSEKVLTYVDAQRAAGKPINVADVADTLAGLDQWGIEGSHQGEFLRDVIRNANDAPWKTNQEFANHLSSLEVQGKLTREDVQQGLRAKQLSPEDGRSYLKDIQGLERSQFETYQQQQAGKRAMNVVVDPTYKTFMFDRIIHDAMSGKKMDFNLAPAQQAQLDAALHDAMKMAQNYRDNNPNTKVDEDMDQIDKIVNFVEKARFTDIGLSVKKGGKPVDTNNNTDDVSGPGIKSFEQLNQLSAPVQQTGGAGRMAGSLLEYNSMLDSYDYAKQQIAKGKPGYDLAKTDVGKFLTKYGVDLNDKDAVDQALKTQAGLYVDAAPHVAPPETHKQPVPGRVRRQP